jgi:hypothetical protein
MKNIILLVFILLSFIGFGQSVKNVLNDINSVLKSLVWYFFFLVLMVLLVMGVYQIIKKEFNLKTYSIAILIIICFIALIMIK